MKKQNYKEQKGITLIALVITIIVMLILVTVSVTIILQNGIFKAASTAVRATEAERDAEHTLSGGTVTIEGAGSQNIEEYVKNLTGTTIAGGMGPINPGTNPNPGIEGQKFSLGGITWYVLSDNGDGTVNAVSTTGMGSLTLGGSTEEEARASWEKAEEDMIKECQRVVEQKLDSSVYSSVTSASAGTYFTNLDLTNYVWITWKYESPDGDLAIYTVNSSDPVNGLSYGLKYIEIFGAWNAEATEHTYPVLPVVTFYRSALPF